MSSVTIKGNNFLSKFSIKPLINEYIGKIRYGYYLNNNIERQRNKKMLEQARRNSKYDFNVDSLVSVIIPTYNRSKILTNRTIPSVLEQTHKNFELIIIGDHCTDDTEERIKEFNDQRIRFINLKVRGDYPENPRLRWLTAGSIPRNKGLIIASGKWIAPLDDDDEFSEDHLEILLSHAVKNKYEMVYGVVQMEKQPNKWVPCGSYPLKRKHICHSSVLYRSELSFFQYNSYSWKYGLEDDWDLWRRMREAKVKIGFVNRVVGNHTLERQQWNL
jgi:glycosyltransferase involved in cell wall biosynthesis